MTEDRPPLPSDGRLSGTVVRSLLRDRAGSLWIGTWGSGLFELRRGELTAYAARDGLSDNFVQALFEDRDGGLFVGTGNGGLNRLRNGRFTSLRASHGLLDDRVLALAEDREGSLWIGTNEGLCRLRDSKIVTFDAPLGLATDWAWSVLEDREGTLWIGTNNGLCRLRDGSVTTYTMRDGLLSNEVFCLHEDREGTLWIGTTRGLNRLSHGTPRSLETVSGAPNSWIYSILEDGDGDLWIGTAEGLTRRRQGTFTQYTSRDGLSSDEVLSLVRDHDGSIWIGTSGGLDRLEGGAIKPVQGVGPTGRSALPLLADSHGVWVRLGGGGLLRVSKGRAAFAGRKDGLFNDDSIHSILDDGRGTYWMSSDAGIFRVGKTELHRFMDGQVPRISTVSYGRPDGMKSPECNGGQPAGWKGRDGRLFFATMKGLASIDPAYAPANTLPPPVIIEDLVIDGRAVPRAPVSTVQIRPGAQKFDIHYTATSLLVPARVRFKYWLEGFDPGWTEARTERSAHYTNLPPRTYTFRVIACNDEGVWNDAGASLSFTVEPRFHQTWLFYALCVLGVAAAGAGIQQIRVKRLARREEELLEAVAQKTRDLRDANEKISRLLAASPAQYESLAVWSRQIASEVAAAIGARAIGIWEVEDGGLKPVSDSGMPPPPLAELEAFRGGENAVILESGAAMPLTGIAGSICGALVIAGLDVVRGDTEKKLVAGFARQLGAALDMAKLRRQLAAAEERRASTLKEMHERGIATVQICHQCGTCTDHTATACPVDGGRLESPRPLPYRLTGRYRLKKLLGQGGMGVVFVACDEKLGRDVAVKLIRPEYWNDIEARQRFEREANAVPRIQHPGVVSLYDSGEMEDGTAFLVMEVLAGCDLALLIRTYGPGTQTQVASLVRQGCEALQAAHLSGVVHRDVKPENVFLTGDPGGFRVKILDFGLAKPLKVDSGLTQTGVVLGTPKYMAPEQVRGGDVDTRADIYSFAAVCYEALTGRPTVDATDIGRLLIQVLDFVPPPVSSLVNGVPPEVDEAFASALAKDPDLRPRHIEAWGRSLALTLERVDPDPLSAGWPPTAFTGLRDRDMEHGPTRVAGIRPAR